MSINLEKVMRKLLEQKEDVVLATIISHSGSTPRTSGSKMIIRSDGNIFGTIGGGLLEATAIESAVDVFKSGNARLIPFNLGNPANADSMDMICGGNVRILLELVKATASNLDLLGEQINLMENGEQFLRIGTLPDMDEEIQRVDRCIFTNSGIVHGEQSIHLDILKELKTRTRGERSPVTITLDNRRFLIEPSFAQGTVFLFGAGHVSQQVAIMANMVDFRIVVLDDREQFANRDRFENADEIIVPPDFGNALSNLEIERDSYVVIVTRGHVHDKTVLEQALRTRAGYIGMIGSRRKRDAIYTALRKEGFTDPDISRVHSPIGMDIGAETPEEIAVSIVGEIIAHRAGIKTPGAKR